MGQRDGLPKAGPLEQRPGPIPADQFTGILDGGGLIDSTDPRQRRFRYCQYSAYGCTTPWLAVHSEECPISVQGVVAVPI